MYKLEVDLIVMKKTISRKGEQITLLESVPDYYLISDKANTTLNRLREGVQTWVSKEQYKEMNISIWVYNDTRVNAFCSYIDEHNYIALSVGLFFAFEKTATEFIEQEGFDKVFELSDNNKSRIIDVLFTCMINYTLAHEVGHIAHGHLKDGICDNGIDEMMVQTQEGNDLAKNWCTQLKEYDADSFAVEIQSLLFLQNWSEDIKRNISNFDIMFLANYLCFRTFAENTGRNFDDYCSKNIAASDHPHPGIRMYYSVINYTYWIGRVVGYTAETVAVISSGCHAVVAYEKNVLEKEKIKECYYSVGFTEKGSQHVMSLHNEWQELIDHYNKYAYITIEKTGDITNMPVSVNEEGVFLSSQSK